MADDYGVSDFDREFADVPILGWLTGAGGRRDAAYNRADQLASMRTWRDIGTGPTAEELTPEYRGEGTVDEYGNLIGGPSQLEGFGPSGDQQAAMAALRSLYEQGGYTNADRAAQGAAMAANAQQVGAMNQAALAGMEARGMGGSGASLAAQLGGSQSLANANQQQSAALQQAAMQRALQSLQGWQSGANTIQGQELARRNALDAFNQSNNDWRRGRETRNTGTANRQQDAQTQARQGAYENAQNWAAGMTNQYAGSQAGRRDDAARQDEQDAQTTAAIGTAIAAAACCSPNTPILTPSGERAISDLRVGDVVYTVHGGVRVERPIVRASFTPVTGHRVVRVDLDNGRTLAISPVHPTVEGRMFGDLKPGDFLGGARVVAAELVPYEHAATYDILPDSDSGAYVAAGAWVGSTLTEGGAR